MASPGSGRKFPGGILLPGILLCLLIGAPRPHLAAEGDAAMMERLASKGFDTRTLGAFLRGGEGGILTAFLAEREIRVSEMQMSFRLRRDQPLRAEYLIVNRNREAIDVSLSGFVDYRRVEVGLGERRSTAHRLHLKAGEWVTRPFVLEDVGEGAHDFLLLGVVSDSAGRGSADFTYPLVFHRANIFVGSEALPQISCHAPDKAGAAAGDRKSLRVRLDNGYDVPVSLVTLLLPRDERQPRNDSELLPRGPCFALASRSRHAHALQLPSTWAPDEVLAIAVESPFARLEPQPGVVARVPVSVRHLRASVRGTDP